MLIHCEILHIMKKYCVDIIPNVGVLSPIYKFILNMIQMIEGK